MRGSPLVRFIILVLALAATGAGLARVTAARGGSEPGTAAPVAVRAGIPPVPYRLLLSAPAESVTIDTGHLIGPAPLSGTLELDPANPRVALTVHWKTPPAPGEHRFAKLTLEAPGQDTISHVFDAAGDIDDLLELPFPAAKHD